MRKTTTISLQVLLHFVAFAGNKKPGETGLIFYFFGAGFGAAGLGGAK